MGNVSIFAGRRAKLLSADGILNSNTSINDNDGVPNLILNGHGEVNTAGWATYADAAAAQPVNGTGGSPTVVIGRETTTVLRGTGSLRLIKGLLASQQGNGWSYDFSMPLEYRSKVMQLKIPYMPLSLWTAGSATADSDVTVWIYDVTNSVLIQPSTYKFFAQSGKNDTLLANFQTSANGSQYRLIFHVSTTTTNPFDLLIDDVSVQPTQYALGTVITDWQSYTPTFTGFGTVTSIQCLWRRVGGSVELDNKYTIGVGTATEARVSLPSGLVSADSTIIPTIKRAGSGTYSGASTVNFGVLKEPSVGYVTFGFNDGSNSGFAKYNGNSFSSSNTYSFLASVPVQGWSSQTITSDVSDQRIVVASYKSTGTPVIGPVNPANYSVRLIDTHAAVTTGAAWKFTAPISGAYRVSVVGVTAANDALHVYKNGTYYLFITSMAPSAGGFSGTVLVPLDAGDYVDIRAGSGTSLNATDKLNSVHIERIANPAILSATETVAFAASGDPASASSGTPIIFPTTSYDTHGAYNAATGRYTAPIAGLYKVYGYINSANNGVKVSIYVDASVNKDVGSTDSNGEASYIGSVRVNAGQIIDLRPNGTLDASSDSTIHIERFGI